MEGTQTHPTSPTIGERIVIHLSQYVRQHDAYVCPPEMAQAGIAHCLGISRAHAAIELKRQMAAGRVGVRIAHVTGLPTRRKVYGLTPKGEGLARSVRSRVLARIVGIVLPDGREEVVPGSRALEVLRRHGVREGRAVLLLLTRSRVDVRRAAARSSVAGPAKTPARSAEARAHAAFRRAFYEPIAWQFEIVLGKRSLCTGAASRDRPFRITYPKDLGG